METQRKAADLTRIGMERIPKLPALRLQVQEAYVAGRACSLRCIIKVLAAILPEHVE